MLQSMNRRFDEYCVEGGHLAAGTFPETSDNSERPRWDAMVSQIKESGLGYLVVVPSAAHLGATLEERVERVLAMDAILCKVVCDDPELPDPLQSAVSLERGTRGERIRAGMLVKAGRGQGLGKSPYGYRLQVDGSLRIVEEEAEVVRSMFQSYADGRGGVRAVAQDPQRSRTPDPVRQALEHDYGARHPAKHGLRRDVPALRLAHARHA